jgi:hypothetical protein
MLLIRKKHKINTYDDNQKKEQDKHRNDRSLSCLETGTSIKSGRVKLDLRGLILLLSALMHMIFFSD